MLRLASTSFILATSLSLLGCATDGADSPVAGGGGKADSETAALAFGGDWSETLSGELVAGSPVRIAYALDRLSDCRGETNGSEVWAVTGYASFDGAAPVTFALSTIAGGVVKPVAPELEIPVAVTSVAMWFTTTNRWGCIAYDSNDNANYNFDIAPSTRGPVLSFEADFSESQAGALAAGQQVIVHYEPSRLDECAASSGGMAKWSVTMHYAADGAAATSLLVTRANGPDLVSSDATFIVPRGGDLAVWFSATNTYGCHAYDSNLGSNYHYPID
jgi:uncharacterized protein YraI